MQITRVHHETIRNIRLHRRELITQFHVSSLNRAAVGWAVSCSAFGLRLTFGLLTAQPQACAGLVLHVVFFFFFFSFVGKLTKTSARPNAGRDI